MAGILKDVDAAATEALPPGPTGEAPDEGGKSPDPPTPFPRRTVSPGSLCAMLGGLLRLALGMTAVVAVVAAAAELALRAAGVQPRGPAGLANVVPDGWTGFRLRPGVAGPEAYATNDLGIHAPRSYAMAPPPGTLRVAVLGSSVVYGLDVGFADTIPGAVERELEAGGRRAEVLNFGTHGFSIVNLSALLQAYVHQLQPQVVVVVVDIQVGLPRWPPVHPAAATEDGIEKLDWWEALRMRGSQKSALLGLFDDPRPARRWVRRASGLPLRPRPRPAPRAGPGPGTPTPATTRAGSPAATTPEEVRAYEERRERELAAPLAAMAAFCAEKSIALYFVTPYGPYFDLTEDDLARMDVHHFLEEAARVHGGERAALEAEAELVTRVVRRVAARGSAHVVDMLEPSRRSSFQTSPDFTADGVHLSPTGNAALGRLIATRISRDLQPGSGARD
jgi:lysophospholipase L1-like esterase